MIKLWLSKIVPFMIAYSGGLLMGLAPAPINAWYLAWFALMPLWVMLIQTKKHDYLLPLAWGIGYHGLAISWITGIHPMTWLGVPWLNSLLIALFCWLFLTLWGAFLVLFWGLSLFIVKEQISSGMSRVIIGTGLWCILEFLWSLTPLWWSSLAYTQSPSNLIILQLSQFSGPTTITAAIVAVNGLLAEGWLLRRKSPSLPRVYLSLALLLLLSLHGWGWWRYQNHQITEEGDSLKIGLIQGNIPNEIKLFSQGWQRAIARYTQGYIDLANLGVDIILTPETALPYFTPTETDSLYTAILAKQVPVWVGTFNESEGQFGKHLTNSLLTITGSGNIYSRYDKVNLVPLGEYIPFSNIFGEWVNRLSPLDASLIAGKSTQPLITPIGKVTVGICYDSAFAEHFRRQTAQGGLLIITAANNAHYSAAMPAQHHAQDVMRAIESDRWLARATNTGYSAIINPLGQTIWLSTLDSYQIHSDEVKLRSSQTLYIQWGDWLTKLLLVVSLLILGKKLTKLRQ